MNKPNESGTGPKNYHYSAHLSMAWICEHTCQKVAVSESTSREHKHDKFHDLHLEVKQLPNKVRVKEIHAIMLSELYHHSDSIPAHHYAAIWAQLMLCHEHMR